jgi:hypothetical protein
MWFLFQLLIIKFQSITWFVNSIRVLENLTYGLLDCFCCWLQVYKLNYTIPRCFDFLKCHHVLLYMANYCIIKSCTFFVYLGYIKGLKVCLSLKADPTSWGVWGWRFILLWGGMGLRVCLCLGGEFGIKGLSIKSKHNLKYYLDYHNCNLLL